MRGKCRHGIKGTGCKFLHPKPCPKLMKHGTRANGGCAKGKNCTDFHPKMSLTKGECFDPSCELKHVKGTCRKKDNYSDTRNESKDGRNNSIGNNNDSQSSVNSAHISQSQKKETQLNFLEIIGLLKTEMMEVMDKKINSVLMYQNQRHNTALVEPVYHQTEGYMNANMQNLASQQTMMRTVQHPYVPNATNKKLLNYFSYFNIRIEPKNCTFKGSLY